MRNKVLCASLLATLVLMPRSEALQPMAAPGLTIRAESLGIEFFTPEGWRLSRESNPEELRLYPAKDKTIPLLRVRAFEGNLSAQDRLAQMTRGLPEEEANVHFVANVTWTLEGRRFETATATYRQGAREWIASFTVVDQPRKLQHGFWLFGLEKDVERHREVVQASIASAKRIARTETGPPELEARAEQRPEQRKPVWADAGSGLRIASWPAGFSPDPKSLKKLAKEGLRLMPSDERAHPATQLLLTARAAEKGAQASDQAAVLHTELGTNSRVSELRRIPVRVGGLEAALLSWVEEDPGGASSFSHQVYFVQHEEAVIKVAFDAEDTWARVRSRRSLVKDFVAGLDFE
jgi:hypothetical protein